MNNYEKYKTIHHPLINPFAELLGEEYDRAVEVRISAHTILNKAVGYAMRKFRDNSALVLIAHDSAADLAEKCARILHRNTKGLHQCNAGEFKVHEDIWVPKDLTSDLDTLSVKSHVTVLFIFLSKQELPEKLQRHPQRVQVQTNRGSTRHRR